MACEKYSMSHGNVIHDKTVFPWGPARPLPLLHHASSGSLSMMFLVSVKVKNALDVFFCFLTQDDLKQKEKLFLDWLWQKELCFNTKSCIWYSKSTLLFWYLFLGIWQIVIVSCFWLMFQTVLLFLAHVDSCARAVLVKTVPRGLRLWEAQCAILGAFAQIICPLSLGCILRTLRCHIFDIEYY